MKKHIYKISGLLLMSTFLLLNAFAQNTDSTLVPNNYPTYRIAIFAPLYLDSAFTNGNYKYGKNFPKISQHGLDFMQGAQIALDSMKIFNSNIEAEFFDSKSDVNSVQSLIGSNILDSFHLIIGAVKEDNFKDLANLALKKNIPFISAIYPNDEGITANPFLVIVNSTLKAHCEAIYAYLLQTQSQSNIIICRKPGSQEDIVENYFKQMNRPDGKPLLNLKFVNITTDYIKLNNALDSTKNNIVIGASLNKDFVGKLVTQAALANTSIPITLIGMPNWDGFTALTKRKEFKNFPIYYTTPYVNEESNKYSKMIRQLYVQKYSAAPSDMVYRGFESVFIFSRLLTRHPNDFINHINEYAYKIFSEYNFKPIFLKEDTTLPDYFENKKLYFMKMQNGIASKAW